MKKILLIAAAALLVAGVTGVAVAASSPRTEMNIALKTDNQTLDDDNVFHWQGIGSAAWQTFTIHYDSISMTFWGDYFYMYSGGNITGVADAVFGGGVNGSGTYNGVDEGEWSGMFLFGDTCLGITRSTISCPPGDGEFWGHAP